MKEAYWRGIIASDNKIAENLCGTFDLIKAMDLANEAFEMADLHLGEWDIEKANALNNIGNIHYLTGQHEQALEDYERALDIAHHEFHEEVLFSAPTSLGIGNVYFGKHQYEEAFKHFQTALETNIAILGEDHPYVANSYLSLGNLYRNKGSYNLATEYYEHALRINKKVFGENHPDVATTYVGIADIYKNSGSYDLAMQYYRQALVIYKRFLHEKNPKYGAIYLGFADVFKNEGDYLQAEEYYQKSLDLFSETIGLEHQNSVRSYLGLGNTYMYQEKFPEALKYYNQVLDINFKLVGENHVNSSAANNNLGSIYYFFGDFELALRFFTKALDIDIAIHGSEHPNVANAYHNIARVYGEKGDISMALQNIQSAINSSIIDFDDQNVFINPVLVNFFDNQDLLYYLSYKGELLEEGFRRSENVKGLDISLNSFILSDSLVDQIRQSYTDRRDQVMLGDLSSKIYESSINASYALTRLLNEDNVKYLGTGASYSQKKKEYEDRFFFFTEKDKGAILFSSLAESNAKAFGGIPETMLYQEKELKDLINSYTQELAANPDSTMLEFYQRELFAANREYEDLIYQFESDYPKYYDLKYDIQITSLDEVQEFLDDSTMMLSYYIATDSIYISQIEKDDFKIGKIYKKRDYEKALKAVRQGILYKSDRVYAKYARILYQQLFPIEIPSHIKNLIIVQDGVMSTIPFEALLTEDVNAEAMDYATLPYLVRDYNISYTFSANLLYKTFMNEKTIRSKAEKDGMVLAPVDFDNALDALREAKEKSYTESDKAMNLRKGIAISENQIPSLPGTEIESMTLIDMFSENGKTADSYLHYEAKEEVAKSGKMDEYNYVHIASHGFVNQEEPEFSGIFMTRDSLTKIEDGILFSGEVYNINLNAELVTLSACETGLGKIKSGEGIIGLSRALIYAGAKNLTVSLWKVSDESTKELMIDFYSNFLDQEIPEDIHTSLSYAYALKKAKIDLINKGGQFAHPYYWSPFVLIGK
ncbi:CHAT domain-containing tetratricopeptide repeat protein [Reichenbachiella sp. 5M10]|uniref:CHAT domain-containing protein n=1 Tax=Reichenbachiella sp. 5M10 TaxID=1889772 RepID=UPI00117BC087|nr:CHAT domain-containing tetratricopeptide repeat protein [Reichenbachiella sp. 5M10]